MSDPTAHPDTSSRPWPAGTPEPARSPDAGAFMPGFDARHHHVDLRIAAGSVVGTLDAALVPAVRAWAEAEGLEAAVDGVVPRPATVARSVRLRAGAGGRAAAVTEVRLGDAAEVVAADGAWRRVRSGVERYLGWIRADDLAGPDYRATHRVDALRGHLYAAPRVQAEAVARVAWGDRLRVREERRGWSEVQLPDGLTAFASNELIAPLDERRRRSPLESWRAFLGTPYLWGGGSAWGIDCSGYTQLLLRMAGIDVPRDADEQHAWGREVEVPEAGDLVCFRGHIGLYLGDDRMAHASGRAMRVIESEAFTSDADRERFLGFVRIA